MDNDILTAERLREVVDYNPETGVFTRKVRLAQRHQVGDRADFIATGKSHIAGYRRLSLDSKRYLAHRCAWLYVYGEWPSKLIDHINGDRGDNRIENLRDVCHRINMENTRTKKKCKGTSKYKGVYWTSSCNKWVARIQVNKKSIHLGVFSCEYEAHKCYLEAKRRLHEGCTI